MTVFSILYSTLSLSLQIVSFSNVFGLGPLPQPLGDILGCAAPDCGWRCFALGYLARPLGVMTCNQFLSKHGDGGSSARLEEDAPGWVTFGKRWVARHGTKGIALTAMAAATHARGLVGLAFLIALFGWGIAPSEGKRKYAFAHFIQLSSIAVLWTQYLLQIQAVDRGLAASRAYLIWFGLWAGAGQVQVTCLLLALSVLACHLVIVSKAWEAALLSECEDKSTCPLFPTLTNGGLIEDDHGGRRRGSPGVDTIFEGGQHDDLFVFSPSTGILPQYAGSPTLCRSYSARELSQFGLRESFGGKGGSSPEAAKTLEEPSPQSAASIGAARQWQVATSWLKSELEYFEAGGLFLLVLIVSAAVSSNTVFGLWFLAQVGCQLLGKASKSRRREKAFWTVNTALLFYAAGAQVVVTSPWMRAVPCDPKGHRWAIWAGLCSSAEVFWSLFLCAWLSGESSPGA